MPSGTPKSGLWRGRKLFREWIRHQVAPPCACGCGVRIAIKPHHRRLGMPRFVPGHQLRVLGSPTANGIGVWIESQQGKHLCHCGCSETIIILRHHHSKGVPRHRPYHALPIAWGSDNHNYRHDRASLKGRDSEFSSQIKKLIYDAFDGRCAWCGVLDLTEFDHVVPVQQGGTSDVGNGQLLCPTCHAWKTEVEREQTKARKRQRRDIAMEPSNHQESALAAASA